MLNKVQYRHIASVSVMVFGVVSVSAEFENVVSATVSVITIPGKSGFSRSLTRTLCNTPSL